MLKVRLYNQDVISPILESDQIMVFKNGIVYIDIDEKQYETNITGKNTTLHWKGCTSHVINNAE